MALAPGPQRAQATDARPWFTAQVAAVETHWQVWHAKGTSCTQTIACTRITRADHP